LKCYDGGGENGITSKQKILKLKYFSSLRILTSPLFEETLGALFSSSFFFFFSFFLFFSAQSLGDFVDI
jgi:hypothetical protein